MRKPNQSIGACPANKPRETKISMLLSNEITKF